MGDMRRVEGRERLPGTGDARAVELVDGHVVERNGIAAQDEQRVVAGRRARPDDLEGP